jgi:hypothetical protein
MPGVSIIVSTLIVNANPSDNAVSPIQYLNNLPQLKLGLSSHSLFFRCIPKPAVNTSPQPSDNALLSPEHFSV